MSDHAFQFVVVHQLQQALGHCDRGMSRVSSGGKSIRSRIRDNIQFWQRQIGLGREALHYGIEPWHLLARDGPCAARPQCDLVRIKVGERVGADRESEAYGHPLASAEILAEHHQYEREGHQQKSRAKNSHRASCLLDTWKQPEIFPSPKSGGAPVADSTFAN